MRPPRVVDVPSSPASTGESLTGTSVAAPGCAQLRIPSTPPMAAPATEHEILDVNRRYHDVAADDYDAKWGIDYGEVGAAQVLGKLPKLLGPSPGPFPRSLEIGAGTGYFSLNLLRSGVVGRRHLHRHLAGHARHAGRQRAAARSRRRDRRLRRRRAAVRGRVVRPRARSRGAAPPARPRALVRASSRRVLRPGGTLFFAGEPSRQGDRIAAWPKRAALRAAPLWRRLVRARPAVYGASAGARRAPTTPSTRSSRWSTCTRSTPATSSA